MLSKLILIFLVVSIAICSYIQYQPIIINAPSSVDADSLFVVTSSDEGQWLVYDAKDHKQIGKQLVVLSGTSDIKIIFSPGLITKTIKINSIPDAFVLKIRSWAPISGRKAVADSLEALAKGFAPEPESEDPILEFLKLTKLNNHALIDGEWKGFFQKLGKYCQENMMNKSLAEHQQLWLRVAEALRDGKT